MSDLACSEPLLGAETPRHDPNITLHRSRPTSRRNKNNWNKKLLWAGVIFVLALRIVACLQDPATALDLERMLYWGLALNQHGMQAAATPLKAWGAPMGVAWRDIPVNYPVIALMFFRAVAGIAPTVTFAKFVLTGIEALNALLVARIAKSKAIGFLYWASPLSIFWVSSEGQFEPVQNLFVLAGMLLVSQAPLLAGFAFALAIQTKVSSALVVAFLLFRSIRQNRGEALKLSAGLLSGFAISVWAQSVVPLVQQVIRFSGLSSVSNFEINPFHSSDPTTIWRSVVSGALVVACVVGMKKTKTLTVWFPALTFLLFVKLSGNIQPWYLLLVPVLAVSTPAVWNRRLLALNGVVDLVALVGIAMFIAATLSTGIGLHGPRSPLKLDTTYAQMALGTKNLESQVASESFADLPPRVPGLVPADLT
jgi:hypothetical protein